MTTLFFCAVMSLLCNKLLKHEDDAVQRESAELIAAIFHLPFTPMDVTETSLADLLKTMDQLQRYAG